MSALAMRALSMAAFAGAIFFSAAAARRVVLREAPGGERGAALTAALVAVSVTFGLQPAATVRPYALVVMFAAMTLWAALREARAPLLLAHLLGLFTHPIFVIFSLASAAAGVACGRQRLLLWGAPIGAVVVYAAVWGVMVARTAALPATSWMTRPTVTDAVRGVLFWGDHATPILAAVVVILLLVRGTRSIGEGAAPIEWLMVLTVFVLAGTIGVSMARPVYLASRTPALVLPAVAIACGVIMAELAPFVLTCAVVVLVSASAVRYTVRAALGPDPYPTGASLAAVAPRMQCGDAVIAAGLSYAPLVYYRSAAGVPSCIPVQSFPADVRDHPGWLDLSGARRSTSEREAELTASSFETGTLWVFVARTGVGADAGVTLVDALSRVRAEREALALRGSFFDEIVAFHPVRPRPARP